MKKPHNPYRGLPERQFWTPSVAKRHFADMQELWDPISLSRSDKVATAGSCFAQHIGRALQERGASYMDMEPAPAFLETEAQRRRFGFGVFSCRYGNIYTSRQLLQLFDEAFGDRNPVEIVWQKGQRHFDALRPGVNPAGHASPEEVLSLRGAHLAAVRRMFEEVDLFVFTLGLTEGWEGTEDGTMFPVAPGTVAGEFDPGKYHFHNLDYTEISQDLSAFRDRLRSVNASASILLTVSPVPLMATASGDHVLVASTYSKSVLRAVAGDLANRYQDVHYFPSYEIISTHPFRGSFFEPDLRNVNEMGVDLVMQHFFSGKMAEEFREAPRGNVEDAFDLVCDEEALDHERV